MSSVSLNHSDEAGGGFYKAEDASPPAKGKGMSASKLWGLFLGMVAANALLIASTQIVGYSWSESPTNTITKSAAFGVFLYVLMIGIAPASIGLYTIHLSVANGAAGKVKTALMSFLLGGYCLALSAAYGSKYLSFAYLWRTSPLNDTLTQLLAGFLVIEYALLTSYCWCIAGAALRRPKQDPYQEASRPLQPEGLGYNWKGALCWLLVGCLTWFLSSFISNVWSYSPTSYFTFSSPFSLIQASWTFPMPAAGQNPAPGETWTTPIIYIKLYEDVCVYFGLVLGLVLLGMASSASPSLRRTLHKRVRFLPLPSLLQLFPQGLTVGEGAVLSSFVGLFIYWCIYWGLRYPRTSGSDPASNEAVEMEDSLYQVQNAARVLGHLTTFLMSFTVFPVTRGGSLESAFGIPFERAIKYHRALGRGTWLLTTLHMLVWMGKWAKQGLLWSNVVTIDKLLICDSGNGEADHKDNFTIVLVEFAWLLMTVSVVASLCRRQNYEIFRYTHYAAWFFMVAAIFHSWNHWYYVATGMLLYFGDKMMGAIRSSRPCTVLSVANVGGVTRLEVDASIFHGSGGHYAGQYAFLCLPGLSSMQWHPFTISSSPGTAKQEGKIVFHIKDMGPGTWTHGLAKMASGGSETSDGGAAANTTAILKPGIQLSIDGPYGRSGHYYERDTLLLIAGGIGITPLHAIVQDLYQRAFEPSRFGSIGKVRQVHLVWTVRERSLVHLFANSLARIFCNPELAGMFQLHIFISDSKRTLPKVSSDFNSASMGTAGGAGASLLGEARSSFLSNTGGAGIYDPEEPIRLGLAEPSAVNAIAPRLQVGKPVYYDIFRAAVENAHRSCESDIGPESSGAAIETSDIVSAMVCGPASMIQDVSELSFLFRTDFHSEVFAF